MKCFPITFILVVVAETLLGAVMSGINNFTYGQEVEENLIVSKRKAFTDHDHRTDSDYAGILTSKNLEPHEIKPHIITILEHMDENKNGFIEKNELTDKFLESYRKLSSEESDSEFDSNDIDGDGYISWKEYVGETYALDGDFEDDVGQEEKDIYLAADIDKDGVLSKIEFRYFYTPEDYPHMNPVVMDGVMKRFDIDNDGKITFDEFIGDRKMELNTERLQEERVKFTKDLDINQNGVLDKDELQNWASPNNQMIAESEADSLISKSDVNKDGILTFDEILDNYSEFISPNSEAYYLFRDEL